MVDLKITLPDHFLDEETRDGYFVSSDMKKVWAVELDLLAEFRRVCDKYGLHWYADGGTMLGAVRHKGFIPWDNDIDISMPRKDYEILCSVAPSEFCEPYFFQTAKTDFNYYRLHAQLRNTATTCILYGEMYRRSHINQGLFIDIFPFDNIPDSDNEVAVMGKELIKLFGRLRFHYEFAVEYRKSIDGRLYKRIKHSVKHILTKIIFDRKGRADRMFDKAMEVSKAYDDNETRRFANMSLPEYTMNHSNFFDKDWYQQTLHLPFEFVDIPVPVKYDEYLQRLYGNWHKYVISGSLHGDIFFDVDKSYKEYIHD